VSLGYPPLAGQVQHLGASVLDALAALGDTASRPAFG
jgi:hypothetical protein